MCVVMRVSSSETSLRSTSTATSSSSRWRLNSGPVAAMQALRQSLLVSLLNLRPKLRHALGRLGKPVERSAQNASSDRPRAPASPSVLQAAAPLLAARSLPAPSYRRSPRDSRACSAPGMRNAAFRSGSPVRPCSLRALAKCRKIGRHQFAIVARVFCWLIRSIESSKLHVPAHQVVFQNPPQFHLQPVKSRSATAIARPESDD